MHIHIGQGETMRRRLDFAGGFISKAAFNTGEGYEISVSCTVNKDIAAPSPKPALVGCDYMVNTFFSRSDILGVYTHNKGVEDHVNFGIGQ